MSIGLEVFKESGKAQGISLSADIDKIYPFQEVFTFPEYLFKYFHELVINIWELQNDITQRRHDEKLFWDFFQLVFQPYGWCDFDTKYLGIKSDMPLAMFAEFYHEMVEEVFAKIGEKEVAMFTDVFIYAKTGEMFLIKNETYAKTEIPDKYKKCLKDQDFLNLINIILAFSGIGIFDSLECSFEEFQIKFMFKNIDDEMFQRIRNLGKVLICDTVNEYITSPVLSINEKGNFVMEIGDKYNIKNGWYTNWADLVDNNEIYALVVEGSVDIQGMVAIAPNVNMKAVYISWMCTSPDNNKLLNNKISWSRWTSFCSCSKSGIIKPLCK